MPFAERGGRLRGVLDLVSGCYPAFLFGLPVARSILPVFHLHEVTPASLEPALRHLADNGYRTVTSDAIGRLVRDGRSPGPKAVALCFDDAWASLWTVAGPLLRRYGFTAITFAIPARLREADAVRATIDEGAATGDEDRAPNPFVTWPELQALASAGTIDVQSHTWSHSMMFSSARPTGFVTPGYAATPMLNRPLVSADGERRYLGPTDLGAPLFGPRSRMTDAPRFVESPVVRQRCLDLVAREGGAAFFARDGWEAQLSQIAAQGDGRFESGSEQLAQIEYELDAARSVLAERLGTIVRHVCLPWGIGGALAQRAAQRLGFDTMFRDHLFGRRVVAAGDDPHSLMRLHERFIFCLPGRGRRTFTGIG